jgi:DNA-binding MarR family transcriptional regulator
VPEQATLVKRKSRVARGGVTGNGTANETIDLGPFEDWVGFHLRMAQDASFQAFDREAHGLEVRPGRFAALVLIGRNPGISQTALSRAISRDKSTLTPLLGDLVRRGLVERSRTRTDRRTYRLKLSASGERVLATLTDAAMRHEVNLDRVIGKRDRTLFLRILRKIAAHVV